MILVPPQTRLRDHHSHASSSAVRILLHPWFSYSAIPSYRTPETIVQRVLLPYFLFKSIDPCKEGHSLLAEVTSSTPARLKLQDFFEVSLHSLKVPSYFLYHIPTHVWNQISGQKSRRCSSAACTIPSYQRNAPLVSI